LSGRLHYDQSMLLGRSEEQRRISRLMAGAQRGESGVLLVVGEPGIGKTALLEYAAGRARGWTVLRTRGTETEAELPFAGLAELLAPITSWLGDLPEPQASALAGALALGPPTALDPFTTYAATLSLMAAAAEHKPVLVLVDDAQWLDRSSQNAIQFAARRLQAESIAMLVALRQEPASALGAADLPRLELGGLEGAVGLRLLRRSVASSVSEEVAGLLVAATGGNPLALKEMPRLLSADQLVGTASLPDPLPLRPDLRQLFLMRIARLPRATRRALLVAAANSSGSMSEIAGALSALGLAVAALEPAEAAGIVEVAAELRFAHPLVRASVYYDASPSSRREAHRALAGALLEPVSAARRAWHLAAATIGQDESVASAMEDAALDARLRGAHAVAARTLERAAELSPAPDQRNGRLIGAASEYQLAGQSDRSLALLQEARESVSDPLSRAELDHLRGRVLMIRGPLSRAHEILADAAHAIEGSHATKAAAMLSDASLACFIAGRAGIAEALSRQAFVLTGERDDQPGEVVHLLFTGMLVLSGNWREAPGHIERERQRILELQAAGQWQPLVLASIWLMWAEENALVRAVLDEAIDEARRLSAPGLLPLPLAQRAELALRTGDWTQAYASSSEAVRLAQDTGQTVILSYAGACLAWTLAGLGREAECRAVAKAALDAAAEVGSESALTRVEAALGLLELGAGRAADAARHLRHAHALAQAHGIGEPTVVPFVADLVEALLRAGRAEEAEEVLGQLEDRARDSPRLWTRAVAARTRGLLAPEGAYEAHFNVALGFHDRLPARFERARTNLAYGERLRRSGLRVRGREQLRAALEEFEGLGAAAWAARARAELRATGEVGTPRRADGIQQLTPQELQVALAVAGGLTNREVAAALFLSPKTIEFHLGKVYWKLEIRSRTQLVRLVAREVPEGVGPQ
jgi:DNA-binding CsgD family transcriptional regulator